MLTLNLPSPGPVKAALFGISDGERGIKETLSMMLRVVHDARASLVVRTAAEQLVALAPQHDHLSEAETLFEFVRDRIRFTQDPVSVELLQTPEQLLARRTGDCDDKAILLASLLAAVGIPSVFVVGGDYDGEWRHVWVEAVLPGGRVSMDPTENHPMGWAPEFRFTAEATTHVGLPSVSGNPTGNKPWLYTQPGAFDASVPLQNVSVVSPSGILAPGSEDTFQRLLDFYSSEPDSAAYGSFVLVPSWSTAREVSNFFRDPRFDLHPEYADRIAAVNPLYRQKTADDPFIEGMLDAMGVAVAAAAVYTVGVVAAGEGAGATTTAATTSEAAAGTAATATAETAVTGAVTGTVAAETGATAATAAAATTGTATSSLFATASEYVGYVSKAVTVYNMAKKALTGDASMKQQAEAEKQKAVAELEAKGVPHDIAAWAVDEIAGGANAQEIMQQIVAKMKERAAGAEMMGQQTSAPDTVAPPFKGTGLWLLAGGLLLKKLLF